MQSGDRRARPLANGPRPWAGLITGGGGGGTGDFRRGRRWHDDRGEPGSKRGSSWRRRDGPAPERRQIGRDHRPWIIRSGKRFEICKHVRDHFVPLVIVSHGSANDPIEGWGNVILESTQPALSWKIIRQHEVQNRSGTEDVELRAIDLVDLDAAQAPFEPARDP